MTLEATFEKAAKHLLTINFKLNADSYVIDMSAPTAHGPLWGDTTYAPRTTPIREIAAILEARVHDIVAVAAVTRSRSKKALSAHG